MATDHTNVAVTLTNFLGHEGKSDYVLAISQHGRLIDVQLHIDHTTGEAKIVRCQSLETTIDTLHRLSPEEHAQREAELNKKATIRPEKS